jgi:hypothetical protein
MTLRRRLIRIWDDNIKMNLRRTGCGYKGCVRTIQGREQWRDFAKKRITNFGIVTPCVQFGSSSQGVYTPTLTHA